MRYCIHLLKVQIILIALVSLSGEVYAQENRSKVDSVLVLLAHTPNDTNKANLLNTLARLHLQVDLDSVMPYANWALKLSTSLKFNGGKGEAYVNLAHYHQNKGSYSLAINEGLKAMALYESMNAKPKVASVLIDMALIHKDLSGLHRTKQYIDSSLSYANAGYAIYKGIPDTTGVISSLITLGLLFRDKAITYDTLTYYDSAFSYYTRALNMINETGKSRTSLPRLYNNLSQVYTEYRKDYNMALAYLFRAMELNSAGDKKLSLTHNYGNISNTYIKLKDHPNALKYARLMLSTSIELKRPERVQNALYQLFQVYKAVHRWDSAHDYYVLADQLNDSLTDFAKTRQVLEIQTQYGIEKKEAAIRQLNIESEHNNKRIVLLISALVVFVILAIGMILLYGRIRRQKSKITEQSAELELVMKELHHRVKNNLQVVSSLLSLQTYKLQDEATISVLRESQMRVQAMSLIHQRLYKTNALTNVNIKEYVTDLAETLMSAYGYQHTGFDLEINIVKEIIDVDKALPIGLIINELVTNAMKYAYHNVDKPLLRIELVEQNNEIVLTIADNGPGLDVELWKKKTGSFGKELIIALSGQLRAVQSVSVNNGTVFTLVIPYKEKTT